MIYFPLTLSYGKCDTQNENLKYNFRVHASPYKGKKKKRLPHKNVLTKEDFIWLYQKTGWINFDELQVTDSTLNEGTKSLVMSKLGWKRRFVVCLLSHNVCHKTCNGWYSGMVTPIYSIVGILILYSNRSER